MQDSILSQDSTTSNEMYPTQSRYYEDEPYNGKEEDDAKKAGYSGLHGTVSRTTTRELPDDLESEISSTRSSEVKEDLVIDHSAAPYSLLCYRDKWIMVGLLTMCGFWSSLGSPIYYPALRQLEKQFDIDENLVNVTVVVYLLFQGLAPTVSGGLADIYGRRPVILIGMLIYVVASIGLAACHSYGVIVFLRCVQSIGISPIIAISSGVVGDFTIKSERGTFVGATSGFVLLGQAFGSLIGAALAARWDWRAIFWFLAIGCGSCLAVGFCVLPETKRTLVGNLSIRPKKLLNIAPITFLPAIQRKFHYDNPDYETLDQTKPKFDLTTAFKICALPEIFLSLFPPGLSFAMWTLMLSSISSELSQGPYNYKLIIIGVCYLPAGIGGLLGSFLTGKFIDFQYRRKLKAFEDKKAAGLIPEDEKFNLLGARIQSVLPQNFLSIISFILFGWSVDKGWKIPAVLITSCVSSFCAMSTLSSSTTLLVDLYPTKSSTASSCFNFIRCSLSALFMGCFAKMKHSMTVGGTFTFLCGLAFLGNLAMTIPMKYGMTWREEREARRLAKEEEKLKNGNNSTSFKEKFTFTSPFKKTRAGEV